MIRRFYSLLERRSPAGLKSLIPQRWRIWLGYQIKVRWAGRAPVAESIARPLSLPPGETEEGLLAYLSRFHQEGLDERGRDELRWYLRGAFRRFLYTLELVPRGQGQLLEIGAGPYYISLLLRRFRDYEATYTNYFGDAYPSEAVQTLVSASERVSFPFANVNIEQETLPYADASFEVVLLCEVLEHFTNDPLRAILEIRRLLRPGGHLILTTPNVNRLENVARMIAGHNIYDPYSGYGPYGRHNREYTREELQDLLGYAGFEIEACFTSDVHENRAHHFEDPGSLASLVAHRPDTLGQYHFLRARKSGTAGAKKPAWLYRSYPAQEIDG